MIVGGPAIAGLLAMLILWASPAPCVAAAGVRLGGHLKSLDLYLDAPPAGLAESGAVSSNSLRLDLNAPLTPSTTFEFAVEGRALYADPAAGVALPGDSPNRRLDLEKNRREDGWFRQQVGVDRLNLSGAGEDFDWTLGRQAIGFGRISLFSPLDIIAPFPPDALDTEVRPGVDAARASRYFGLAGQLGTALVLGGQRERNSYLVYGETNILGVDLLGLAGELRRRPLAGVGFASQLKGMGIKGEATCFRGKQVNRTGGDRYATFAIAAAEVDYRFANGLILFAQYLFNGAGVDAPSDYPRAAASATVAEGLGYLLGRHYLLSSASYELHPLVTLNGLVIWNLADDSFLLRPMLSVSLADNLALELFWSANRGAAPETAGDGASAPVPRSEFGSAGNLGGLLLKFFF